MNRVDPGTPRSLKPGFGNGSWRNASASPRDWEERLQDIPEAIGEMHTFTRGKDLPLTPADRVEQTACFTP